MVALDVLFDELLDAGCKQGQRALLFPLLERDLIVERPREQVFEVRRECRRLRFGPFAIAGVSFGPLVFPRWAAPDFLPDFLIPCDIAETGVGYMKRTVPKSRESSGDDACQTFRIWIQRQNRSEIVEKI